MDIDSRNYKQHKQLILQHIRKSSFIAFDFEFTGLTTVPEAKENQFQDEEEHYQKIREICSNFGPLQLGITCFGFEGGHYHPHTYNIYVRNPPKGKNLTNCMVIDSDSMAFLAQNGMDFARVFQFGIYSRRLNEKEQVIDESAQKICRKTTLEYQVLSSKDQQRFKCIECELLESFQKGSRKDVIVNFQAKQLLQHAKKKYNLCVDKGKKTNLQEFQYLVRPGKGTFYLGNNMQVKQNHIDQQRLEEMVTEEMGISQLVGEMLKCRVPLVGHFVRIDLGYLYHCYIGQLPKTFSLFEAEIQKHFPYLFDTKVIAREAQKHMKGLRTDLGSLAQDCLNPNKLFPYNNVAQAKQSKYVQSACSHEAGYDSYVTGLAFAAMANLLVSVQQAKLKNGTKKADSHHQEYFDPKQQVKFPVVDYSTLHHNRILYSKQMGEVVLGSGVRSHKYDQVLILDISLQDPEKQIAETCEVLRQYGSLKVTIKDKIYISFLEKQDIPQIIEDNPNCKLVPYLQRRTFVATQYLK